MLDAVVIGAGFGGLGAALELTRRGARVALCETLNYPGGCASTFSRGGYCFEAGATLFSGFAEGQLFQRWVAEEQLDVTLDWLDPPVELRTPGWTLPIDLQRSTFIERLKALPGAPREGIDRFFETQRQVASALWPLLDDADRLNFTRPASLAWHAARLPKYAPLARLIGRPVQAVLERCGVARFEPLRLFADALCQITVQCPATEAEAPFALSSMEYCWRGTAHVRGGIGVLARALCAAIEKRGGQVLLANKVKGLTPIDGGWHIDTRTGPLEARAVIANVLPGQLASLASLEDRRLTSLEAQVQDGWGAAMRYLVVAPPAGAGAHAHHLQLVADRSRPLLEGNHVFMSISGAQDIGRAPEGFRTVTTSTHVPLSKLRGANAGEVMSEIDARLLRTVQALAPEWMTEVKHSMSGSPRTFQRFSGRANGAVGGIPRRAGLHNYRGLFTVPVRPGLWMVGDSVFPGQSTLATALSGVRVARALGA